MPISNNGVAYHLSGPKGKPTVALIHGLGLNRHITWEEIEPVLAQRYRVLNYDLLGHGESALPQSKPDLTMLSRQLIKLMDELSIDRVAAVGFSLGGMINRRMAIDYPDRVSSLIILNSPHERGEEAQRLVEERLKDTQEGGAEATIDATLKRWLTVDFIAQRKAKLERIKNIVLANDKENYANHRYILAHGVKELIRPTPEISIPALVMTSEHDSGSTPAMSEGISNEITDSEIYMVPGLKHLGLIEQPDIFADKITDFLYRKL
ncbi:MAG: alpha/beta hydrolase [Paracoccaceae bacterium]|nr:alpha/beta hydrolase [Paracoccaceae bacterium]MDE2916935.1 alpha/beta hydrolase [Paracoccaceae bacterium]